LNVNAGDIWKNDFVTVLFDLFKRFKLVNFLEADALKLIQVL